MDSNNWRPAQNEAPPPMDGGDWRSQLLPESRQRIVNKIMETLKRHLPFSDQGLQELKQIAIRFEEKIYSAATSQSDYLKKISLKLLTMESKSLNSPPNASPSNSSSVSRIPQESVLCNGTIRVNQTIQVSSQTNQASSDDTLCKEREKAQGIPEISQQQQSQQAAQQPQHIEDSHTT